MEWRRNLKVNFIVMQIFSKIIPLTSPASGLEKNGHLAFNDPAFADFNDPMKVKVVEPDPISRNQQVHDSCFECLEQVPRKALTLTIPAILLANYTYCMVPGSTKADAVRKTLRGPISTECPASILRTHKDAILYLDNDSAKLVHF
jgi:glucosamine-6-phosphate deaminase